MSAGEVGWAIVKLLVACVPLAISVTALLDCARRPEWAFAFVGRSRTVWVTLTGIGVLFCGPGIVTALWYWFKVRPAVARVERGELS